MQADYIIKKLDAAFCERSVVLPNLWVTFKRILLKYHQSSVCFSRVPQHKYEFFPSQVPPSLR